MSRILTDDRFELLPRLDDQALPPQHDRQIVARRGILRSKSDRFQEVHEGLVRSSETRQRVSEVGPRFRERRIQLDCLLVLERGGFELPRGLECFAQAVPRLCISRIQAERRLELHDRLVGAPFQRERRPEVPVGCAIGRLQFDNPGEESDGFGRPALSSEGDSQVCQAPAVDPELSRAAARR